MCRESVLSSSFSASIGRHKYLWDAHMQYGSMHFVHHDFSKAKAETIQREPWTTDKKVFLDYFLCIKCFTNYPPLGTHSHPRHVTQRLFVLHKDSLVAQKGRYSFLLPSRWRNRDITRGSWMPQFQKHVLFLPVPLGNITGVPSSLSCISNPKVVFFFKNLRWNGLEICRRHKWLCGEGAFS